MNNPNLALWLYVAILAMAFMFSPRWGEVLKVIGDGTKAKTG
jgi:hypothetical protein